MNVGEEVSECLESMRIPNRDHPSGREHSGASFRSLAFLNVRGRKGGSMDGGRDDDADDTEFDEGADPFESFSSFEEMTAAEPTAVVSDGMIGLRVYSQ